MDPIYSTEVPFVHEGTCFLVPNALDAAACARLIREATAQGFACTAGDYPPGYRDNDRLVRDDPALAAALVERLRPVLPDRLVDARGEAHRLVGLNERFRFCRYEGGQGFRVHRDGAHAPGDGRRSRLTVQIYLDDAAGFTGGRTRFYASRNGACVGAVTPARGAAIVFDHDLWHDGEPVTAGRKHVLRTDAIYEREQPAIDDGAVATTNAPERDVLRGHRGYVYRVIALEGGALATASRDRTVRVWREGVAGWSCARVIEGHAASVHALCEVRPGLLWSGSRDRTVRAHDLATSRSRVVAERAGAVLAIERLGRERVAIGAADGEIHVHDHDGARVGVLAGHRGFVWSLASLGGGLLASAGDDGSVRLWNDAGCLDAAWPERGPAHAVVAIDDHTIAAGFADGHVVVYALDRLRGALAPVDVLAAHRGEVYALASLGEDLLASGGEDDHVRVHRLRDRACLRELAHDGFVRSIARLDRHRIAAASYDGTVRIGSRV